MTALVIAAGAGCRKSEPGQGAPPPGISSVETVARVHWLGKKQLAAETNAAAFMEICNLPESAKLETQTLDKLALAPWLLLKGDAATNGAPVALLRALLDDLVQAESYLEIRGVTNKPGELAFAIRLGPERARLWETNLAAVLESLTGIRPVSAAAGRPGWSLKKHDAPKLVELTRAGDWTLVGLAPETNALLGDFLARIESRRAAAGAPFAARTTNFWLEAGLDLRRVSRALTLAWNLPEEFPRITVAVIGSHNGVRTQAELAFARPLPLELEPWNVPTNLIHGPLVGFTAVRGVKPWLTSLKKFGFEPPIPWPNQFYSWTLGGFPLEMFFAAPLPDASNQVNRLAETLIQKVNPWLATNGTGRIEPLPMTNGVWWSGLPMMQAFLQSVHSSDGDFVLGGLVPYNPTNQPIPAELLQAISSQTNLIAYQWEITQPGLETWLLLGQTLRLAFEQAQFPPTSASMAWLKSAALKLGNTVTFATRTGPAQIAFVRHSNLGLTSLELHLLVDWLESPQFPRGLHTLLAPPPLATSADPPPPK